MMSATMRSCSISCLDFPPFRRKGSGKEPPKLTDLDAGLCFGGDAGLGCGGARSKKEKSADAHGS